MSAVMFAQIKELTARVDALEERIQALVPDKPKLTDEQHLALKNQRQTLKLSLKKVQP